MAPRHFPWLGVASFSCAVAAPLLGQSFAFGADYAAGASEVAFGFGFKRQTVEIGGLDFIYYGRSVALADLPRTRPSYAGRETGAAWRAAALARIEQLRKSDFAISVVDPSGRPVPGAQVRVEQRRQAFQFGSALQMARLVRDSAENRIYGQKVLELFNAGGPENDLKWPAWSGEWGGNYNQAQTMAGLTWLKNTTWTMPMVAAFETCRPAHASVPARPWPFPAW